MFYDLENLKNALDIFSNILVVVFEKRVDGGVNQSLAFIITYILNHKKTFRVSELWGRKTHRQLRRTDTLRYTDTQ